MKRQPRHLEQSDSLLLFGETKCILSRLSRYIRRSVSQVMVDNYNFDFVKEFNYHDLAVTSENEVCLEINPIINIAHVYY